MRYFYEPDVPIWICLTLGYDRGNFQKQENQQIWNLFGAFVVCLCVVIYFKKIIFNSKTINCRKLKLHTQFWSIYVYSSKNRSIKYVYNYKMRDFKNFINLNIWNRHPLLKQFKGCKKMMNLTWNSLVLVLTQCLERFFRKVCS